MGELADGRRYWSGVRVIAYDQCSSNGMNEVVRQVQEYIGNGWEPYGPLVWDGQCYVQPVVRYVAEDTVKTNGGKDQ